MKLVTFTRNLFFILTIIPSVLVAQPVLTEANNPVPLQSYSQQDALTPDMGPGGDGANTTWDFSMLMPDGDPFSFEVDLASNSAFADSFPEATLFSGLGEDSLAFFFKADANGIEILGTIGAVQDEETMLVDTFALKFSDPQTVYSYPFGAQSSVDDTYRSSFDLFGLGSNSTTGTQTQEGSGYGTLTTPAGTFDNVLRIKTTSVETDSLVALGGLFSSVSTTYSTQYSWHQPGEFNILMIWSRDSVADEDFGSSVDTTVSYGFGGVSTAITEQLERELSLTVFPSPMVDQLQVSLELDQRENLQFSLYDLAGRMVAGLDENTFSQGAHTVQLAVAELVAGTYFLRIQVGERALLKKVQKL